MPCRHVLPGHGLLRALLVAGALFAAPRVGAEPDAALAAWGAPEIAPVRDAAGGRGADVSLALGWRSGPERSELLGGLWLALPFDGRFGDSEAMGAQKAKRAAAKLEGSDAPAGRPATNGQPSASTPSSGGVAPAAGASLTGGVAPAAGVAPKASRRPPGSRATTADEVASATGRERTRSGSDGPGAGRAVDLAKHLEAPPGGGSPPPSPSSSVTSDARLARLVAIPWQSVREAVARASAGADAEGQRAGLDDLASRARRSAALPQLRLRAMRVATESSAVAPTSYDPLRQTASGGTSVWLEARLTWQLDRALFAPEELRLARLAQSLDEVRARRGERAVELVRGWQAAVAERLDPSASFRECRAAYLREIQLATELDLLTGGWFSAERARGAPLPAPDCLAVAERVER